MTSFMRGAISATRSDAPLHQCSFHMSQITMAVLAGSQATVLSTTCHWPLPLAISTRLRVGRSNGAAGSAPALARATSSKAAAAARAKWSLERTVLTGARLMAAEGKVLLPSTGVSGGQAVPYLRRSLQDGLYSIPSPSPRYPVSLPLLLRGRRGRTGRRESETSSPLMPARRTQTFRQFIRLLISFV